MVYEAVFHDCVELCGAHNASAEYRNPTFAEAGWYSHLPFSVKTHWPTSIPLVRREGQLVFYQTEQQTQGTSTSKAHVAGLVTERPGVTRVPHFLGGFIHALKLFIMLPSLTYPVLHIQPEQVSVLEICTDGKVLG